MCRGCYKSYKDPEWHKFPARCILCQDSSYKYVKSEAGVCPDCNRYYRSLRCKNKKTNVEEEEEVECVCLRLKKCLECGFLYKRDKVHKGPLRKCPVCGVREESGEEWEKHLCYIQPLTPELPSDKIIFSDFETYVEPLKQTHVPFLVCIVMLDSSERFEAHGPDCVEMFVKRERYRGSTLIAHNSRGFDGFLVLRQMVVGFGLMPTLILQGSKVIQLSDPRFGL